MPGRYDLENLPSRIVPKKSMKIFRGNALLKALIISVFFAMAALMGAWKLKEIFTVDFEVLAELQSEKVRVAKLETSLKAARLEEKIGNIGRTRETLTVLAFMGVGGVSTAAIIFSGLFGWGKLRQSSLVPQQVGENCTIQIHYRDIRDPRFWVFVNVIAEARRLEAEYPERGLDMSMQLLQTTLRSIGGRRGMIPALMSAMPTGLQVPAAELAPVSAHIPTFAELLQREEIAPGKPMILSYIDGIARRGGYLDIYSSAIAGESGSGKTSTMLFLIGAGIVAENIRFLVIDPHYPHPKSLAYKTKPLWDAGLIEVGTTHDEAAEILAEVDRVIDDRMSQKDTDETPIVLVIDELHKLMTTGLASQLTNTMQHVSIEGRKCSVYMLAGSQTWLAATTGNNSVARDTLTSAYVHRIKPKQANLILQDPEETRKVKKFLKQPGDVMFCPVNDAPQVAKMPLATEYDMKLVANMCGSVAVPRPSAPAPENATAQESFQDMRDWLKDLCDSEDGFFMRLVEASGSDKGQLSATINKRRPMSEGIRQKIESGLKKMGIAQLRGRG